MDFENYVLLIFNVLQKYQSQNLFRSVYLSGKRAVGSDDIVAAEFIPPINDERANQFYFAI